VQINAYKEGTEVNTEVNGRVFLKNLGRLRRLIGNLEYKARTIDFNGTNFLQLSESEHHFTESYGTEK